MGRGGWCASVRASGQHSDSKGSRASACQAGVLATAVLWTSVPGTHLSSSDLMHENVLPGGGLENRLRSQVRLAKESMRLRLEAITVSLRTSRQTREPQQTAADRYPGARIIFRKRSRYCGPTYLFSDTEAFSIFFRIHFHLLDKCSTQCLFIAKTGNSCDFLKR